MSPTHSPPLTLTVRTHLDRFVDDVEIGSDPKELAAGAGKK